jgi:hypothetical protein
VNTLGEVDFWIFFWIFNFLQLAIDWQNNSKAKVEKVIFFTAVANCRKFKIQKIQKLTSPTHTASRRVCSLRMPNHTPRNAALQRAEAEIMPHSVIMMCHLFGD